MITKIVYAFCCVNVCFRVRSLCNHERDDPVEYDVRRHILRQGQHDVDGGQLGVTVLWRIQYTELNTHYAGTYLICLLINTF